MISLFDLFGRTIDSFAEGRLLWRPVKYIAAELLEMGN
jgi:hypothetical protein